MVQQEIRTSSLFGYNICPQNWQERLLLLMFLNSVLLLCWVVGHLCAKSDNEVTIGGIFSLFDDDYNVDQSQIEHLNAFALAIDEINANTTLLPDHTLKLAVRNGHHIGTVATAVIDLLAINDLAGVVSAIYGEEALVATRLISNGQKITVNSMASDAALGDPLRFPFNTQIHPLDSYVGTVLQSVMCEMAMTRTIIFGADNFFGYMLHLELLDGQYCDIEELVRFDFASWNYEFDDAITQSLESGATVFVIALSEPAQIAKLLEDGHQQGLFREGTQLFLLREDFTEHLTGVVDKDVLLKGVIAVEYDANYGVDHTSMGEHFLAQFPLATDISCSDTDSTGHTYIVDSGHCAPLTHSEYGDGTRNYSDTAALSYDAVYTLALGLHHSYQHNASGILNSTLVRDRMLHQVDFIGASGHVNLFLGRPQYDSFGQGVRKEGNTYEIVNFDQELFDAGAARWFSVAKIWNSEDGLTDCPADFSCKNLTYNTLDNSPPSSFPDYALEHAPEVIKIGGLFASFKLNGQVNLQQAEHLEAFLMAIEDINNKTDGLFDDALPGSKVVFAAINDASTDILAVAGVEYLYDSFYHSHVVGVVSALPSQQSTSADLLFTENGVFVSFSEANDTDFASPELHPHAVHTNVIDADIGTIMQQVLCDHYIDKVTVLHSITRFGTRSTFLLGDHKHCDISKLSVHEFLSGSREFVNDFDHVKKVGARVFALMMGPADAAAVLEEGHAAGVFEEGTMVLLAQAEGLFGHFSADADVPAIMKGVHAVQYFPDYSVKATDAGRQFHERFTSRNVADPNECNSIFDDNQVNRLYVHPPSGFCAELNFSAYRAGDRQVAPWTANTYDATMMLLLAVDQAIKTNPNAELTAETITAAALTLSFEGATGQVSLSEGDADAGFSGKGSRTEGLHFRLLNFQEDAYEQDPADGFRTVGLVSSTDGMIECPDHIECFDAIYNTRDQSRPQSSKPVVHVRASVATIAILGFIAALIFLFAMFLFQMIYTYGDTRHIKNSQGSLLYFIVAGGFCGAARIILGALHPTEIGCVAEVWLGHFSFALIFGAVVVKSYRLHMIFNTEFLRSSVTTERCLLIVTVGLAVMLVLLVVLTIVGQPMVAHERVVESNQTFDSAYCSMVHPEAQTVLYLVEALFLALGFKMAYELKDIPDKYNESEMNMDAVSLVVFAGVVIFPLMYLVNMDPVDATAVSSILLGLVVLALLVLLFILKILKVYKMVGIKIHSRSTKSLNKEEGILVEYPMNVITDDDKFDHCQLQIDLIQAALAEIGRDDSTHGSSAGGSQSSQHSSEGSQHSSENG